MKNFTLRAAALFFATLFIAGLAQAQNINNTTLGKGLQFIAADSSFSTKIGVRFQTLYDGNYSLATDKWNDQFLIRRARLKFSGFAYSPKLEYKIELGLTNRDIGAEPAPHNNFASNIILDAVAKYNFAPGFELWAGQTKLPGNRERVISSQKLQFVDRSNLNSRYNLDRDIGLQLHHEHKTGNIVWRQIFAWSIGEGRNITTDNQRNDTNDGPVNLGGYGYTGRIEMLPFGAFKNNGDYIGSDIYREETPKLSLGASYDYNDNAARQRGQLGSFMSAQRDIRTVFADAIFKYRGWSVLAEYADKKAPDGAVVSYTEFGEIDEAFFTGTGFNIQSGYLFKNNFEVAGRYTAINPENKTGRPDNKEYTLGFSRYIVGHGLKLQSDVSYIDPTGQDNEDIRFRMQMEVSF